MSKFSPELRKRLIEEAKGKVVEALEYDEVADYWILTFTTGEEFAFRHMAEIDEPQVHVGQ